MLSKQNNSSIEYTNAKAVINKIKDRRDNSATVAKRLIVGTVIGDTPIRSMRSNCSELGVSFRTLKRAMNEMRGIEDARFITHMSRNRKSTILTVETKELVEQFFNSVGRECPYRKNTINVNGVRKPIFFLEKTLTSYYQLFKQHHPNIVISQSSFEKLRPKNVKLKAAATRQVCCCTQHTNIEYLRKKLNELLRVNQHEIISDNDNLVLKTICNIDSINCIERRCNNCGVDKLENLQNLIKYCSYECMKKGDSCKNHTVVLNQFKRTDYTNKKGETKKKMSLVTERYKIVELLQILKCAMVDFPRHRFNHYHTKGVYQSAIDALNPGQIVKIQDYSENYTCLVPGDFVPSSNIQKR